MSDTMKIKERPIIFSGAMVKAILDGKKTQTRRVIKICNDPIQPSDDVPHQKGIPDNAQNMRMCGYYLKCDAPAGSNTVSARVDCPYGHIGDHLFVKEHHARIPSQPISSVHYFADGPMPTIEQRHDAGLLKSYPSIFMPRWASRITLEITGVRVERLQAITEADAEAEGAMHWWNSLTVNEQGKIYNGGGGAKAAFQMLWESINGKDSWKQSPFVWVVEFKRITPTNQATQQP